MWFHKKCYSEFFIAYFTSNVFNSCWKVVEVLVPGRFPINLTEITSPEVNDVLHVTVTIPLLFLIDE